MLAILLWVSKYDTDQSSHLTTAALRLNFSSSRANVGSTCLLSASPESPVSPVSDDKPAHAHTHTHMYSDMQWMNEEQQHSIQNPTDPAILIWLFQ